MNGRRDETRADERTRLDTVTISVRDVVRSIGFFRDLGLTFPSPGDDSRFVSRLVPGVRIDWVESADAHPFVRVGVRCPSPSDVDRLVDHLRARGHRIRRGPEDVAWGARSALVVDPDGGLVELYAPYP